MQGKFNFNPVLLPFPGIRWLIYGVLLIIIWPRLWALYQSTQPYNAFDVNNASVALRDIESGGPGRDDIPALTDPAVVDSGRVDFLSDDDLVLGVVVGDKARAYPVKILNWHEVVNDRLGDTWLLITYCPLCGTGVVFEGTIEGERLLFGVSGLLYRNNLLMYDRNSESLWAQMRGEAISGLMRSMRLQRRGQYHFPWGEWRRRYPDTDVLSVKTGYRRDYDRDPYAEYARMPAGPDGEPASGPVPAKAQVVGVEYGGATRAYPFAELALHQPVGHFTDHLGEAAIVIEYDALRKTAVVRDHKGNVIPSTVAYWFAWVAFSPDTDIYLMVDTDLQ